MCSDSINRKKNGSRKGPKQMPGSSFSQKQKMCGMPYDGYTTER